MVEQEKPESNQDPDIKISQFSFSERLLHDPDLQKKMTVAAGLVLSVIGVFWLRNLREMVKSPSERRKLENEIGTQEASLNKHIRQAEGLGLHKEREFEIGGTFLGREFKFSVPQLVIGCLDALRKRGIFLEDPQISEKNSQV